MVIVVHTEDYRRRDGEVFRIAITNDETKLILDINRVSVLKGKEYLDHFHTAQYPFGTQLSEIIQAAKAVTETIQIRR